MIPKRSKDNKLKNPYEGPHDGRSIYDKNVAKEIMGKHVIVGFTHNRTDGTVDRHEQMHGVVVAVEKNSGVAIKLHNSEKVIWIPPDLRSFVPAQKGIYTLRSTGEKVVNPDYLSNWIVDITN